MIESVTWNESWWQTWQTFTTVGYGNKPAETISGRWTTMLFATIGIALLGAVFSAVIDLKQYLIQRRISGFMKNKFKDGYVIFNFPGEQQALRLINELRTVEPEAKICFVDENLESLPNSINTLENVCYIRGNSIHRDTYERANIQQNSTIIVFPIDTNSSNSDGTTKTIIDLVLDYCNNRIRIEFFSNKIRVLYVLVDQNNRWMFRKEAIPILRNFWILALVQECQDPYTSSIMENILSNSMGENIRTVRPNKIVNWMWQGFLSEIVRCKLDIKVLALIRRDTVIIFPEYNTQIFATDLISIVAKNDCDWEEIERILTI